MPESPFRAGAGTVLLGKMSSAKLPNGPLQKVLLQPWITAFFAVKWSYTGPADFGCF